MGDSRHTIAQMAGELLRELGILLVAFAPLDYVFAERTAALTPVRIGEIVAVGVGFSMIGIVIERRRRP